VHLGYIARIYRLSYLICGVAACNVKQHVDSLPHQYLSCLELIRGVHVQTQAETAEK